MSGLRLPEVVLDAAHLLGAPAQQWGAAEDVYAWAEESLYVMVACGVTRHRVRLRPEALREGGYPTVPAPATPGEEQRMDASHMLWALQQDRPRTDLPCETFGLEFMTWVGPHFPRGPRLWSGGARHRRMMGWRTLYWTVEYLRAGLDLVDHQRWLRLGIDPDMVDWMRRRLAAHGRTDDEPDWLDTFEERTGLTSGEPGRGGYVSDVPWMAAVFQEYIGFAGPGPVAPADATPARATETVHLA